MLAILPNPVNPVNSVNQVTPMPTPADFAWYEWLALAGVWIIGLIIISVGSSTFR